MDVTTYLYFTLFTPLVYWTFLAQFFSSTQSVIMFSYKPQLDDNIEETADNSCADNIQIPHQLSCSSLKTDSEFVFQRNSGQGMYESTQFAVSASLSPDSCASNHSFN